MANLKQSHFPFTPVGVRNMSTLNELIQAAHGDGQLVFTNEMMAAAAARLMKERETKAVEVCQELIEQFNSHLVSSVRQLKAIREQELAQQKRVKALDRAFRFFGETGNPLPFYKELGNVPGGNEFAKKIGIKITEEAWLIPKEWEPKTN